MYEVIHYSRLLDRTYIDLSSDRKVLLLILYLDCTTDQRSILFRYHLHLLVQAPHGFLHYFLMSLQFLQGMLKDQNTVDQES